MRLGVLTDGKLSVWQRRALERACGDHEIYLLVSKACWRTRREAKHALYYALNLFTVRNRLTRMVDLPDLRPVDRIEFEPAFEGAWALLPDELTDWINAHELDVIIKFGLGLLRVPPPERLRAPILSFHHGDPRKYRGRPAGFYELLNREPFMGQIVQAIGAQLDAGTIYAFSETRVLPHSYRQTLIDSFALSPYLLGEALENVRLNRPLPIVPDGHNYRLPGNWTVARFVAGRLWAALGRAAYGMFVDKRWKVATAPVAEARDPLEAIGPVDGKAWNVVPIASRYSFYADPFFGDGAEEIFVEAMNRRSGKGEVVRIVEGRSTPIRGLNGHVSYPASIEEGGRRLLVPETTGWCPLTAFSIEDAEARAVHEIEIDEARLVDPTFVRHKGRIYLFANVLEDGTSVLHLWHADSLGSKFTRHLRSPIRVSARGSRMAGEIAEWNGGLYRIGQLWRRSYGDGVVLFRITALSESEYAEECVGEASFEHVCGPHTINRRDGLLLFDYYSERLSPLAGVRRLLNRL